MIEVFFRGIKVHHEGQFQGGFREKKVHKAPPPTNRAITRQNQNFPLAAEIERGTQKRLLIPSQIRDGRLMLEKELYHDDGHRPDLVTLFANKPDAKICIHPVLALITLDLKLPSAQDPLPDVFICTVTDMAE